MSRDIAPSAVIHPRVSLPDNIRIEDFVIVGKPARAGIEKDTMIGDGCYLRSHTVIYSGNRIGVGFQTGHGVLLRDDNEIGESLFENKPKTERRKTTKRSRKKSRSPRRTAKRK